MHSLIFKTIFKNGFLFQVGVEVNDIHDVFLGRQT